MSSYSISGNSGKLISFDLDFPKDAQSSPIIIFLHGFKGFKDWGQWPILAKEFTKKGFAVLRMNFSHNGTTPQTPLDFSDLEAFGRNTFSKETEDVQSVINWLYAENDIQKKIDVSQLFLVAHSRGGAIAMITAAEDDRVQKIATLSAVGTLQRFSEQELEAWKQHGVIHILNGRTNQNMPLYYDLAKDYLANENRFNLAKVVPRIKQPFLVIHAQKDETVSLSEANDLVSWAPNSTYVELENANHSFGGTHPFSETELPPDTQKALEQIVSFLNQ